MKVRKAEKREIALNMTSMLDIVFQLIIFFILVTNFAAADLPELEPPTFPESKAQKPPEETIVRTVNIVPELIKQGVDERGREIFKATGRAAKVILGAEHEFAVDRESMAALTQVIKDIKDIHVDKSFEIDLRVDQRLTFDQVQPVMVAITGAGVNRVNLVALVDVVQ